MRILDSPDQTIVTRNNRNVIDWLCLNIYDSFYAKIVTSLYLLTIFAKKGSINSIIMYSYAW